MFLKDGLSFPIRVFYVLWVAVFFMALEVQMAKHVLAKSGKDRPFASQSDRDLPKVFALDCVWSETTTVYAGNMQKKRSTRAASLSAAPKKVNLEHEFGWFEVVGLRGARHFVFPSTGSLLAGQFFTILADGRATRSSTVVFNDKVQVQTSIGHCEVSE